MVTPNTSLKKLFSVLLLLLISMTLSAQDLDPRAYIRVPIGTNIIISGFSYMTGDIVTDPSLPIKNIKANVQAFSPGYVHSFNLLGLTAQALVVIPYTWAQVAGEVGGQEESITRSGFADTRLRLSVLFLGAPAATLDEIKQAPRKTILGFSINVMAPTGQYYSDKLINLGTHRWSIRPELALSQPFGNRWLVDVYSGLWFFTDNNEFYPGNSQRTQEPMASFQGHISYTIRPFMWVAFNTTYYVGGTSLVNNTYNDDRQSNARVGITAAFPLSQHSSLRFTASKGAIVRVGQNFTTYSLAYQYSWMNRSQKPAIAKPE